MSKIIVTYVNMSTKNILTVPLCFNLQQRQFNAQVSVPFIRFEQNDFRLHPVNFTILTVRSLMGFLVFRPPINLSYFMCYPIMYKSELFQVYHLACLGRDKMPREKWFCPWHHCVQCGKLAVAFCMHCPNAYCRNHNTVINS